jgi:hypothetical protein
MVIADGLKRAICALFEVHADEGGVQRVVTPLEYPGSHDRIVVRVRPIGEGTSFTIDENGEAAFYACLNGGHVDSEVVNRWAAELATLSPAKFLENEKIAALATHERLIAPYIFRVAEAAQQLHAIATARASRQESDFKERVKQVVQEVAANLNIHHSTDVELPIAGGLIADHMLGHSCPLLIITATSATRLLEAEVIYMQYRAEAKKGFVLAVAESQESVGKKQYERSNYYTHKAVIFNRDALGSLITGEIATGIQ